MMYEYPSHSPMGATRDHVNAEMFGLFKQLPVELRLKIWKLALPGPRIVDITVKNPGRPDIEYGTSQSNAPNLRWFWVVKCPSPALLDVSHEARDVALETYEAPGAWDTSFSPWRRAYIDYSVDTFYFSNLLYKAVLFSRKGSLSKFDKQSIDFRRVQSLALDSWPRMRQFEEPSLRHESVTLLQFIIRANKALNELFLVIDGRASIFDGPDRLVDPTNEFPDYVDDLNKQKGLIYTSNKQNMLQLIEDVVKDTAVGYELQPDILMPPVKLKLLINGPDNPPIERRWFYGRACCETYAQETPLVPLGRNSFEYFFD